jgi:DNA-3-methyladenine glycosylase I
MRCDWANTHSLLTEYHDKEWGVPEHDDQTLFQHLTLDCFQAGLSWLTILKKRENFKKAFNDFDIEKIAAYDSKKIQELLADPGIIRNRMKIESIVSNARQILEIKRKFKSFDKFIWNYTQGKPIVNTFHKMSEIPPRSAISDEMSRDLKNHGLKFVGSTICYAFMQSIGMVNDHIVSCPRHQEVLTI